MKGTFIYSFLKERVSRNLKYNHDNILWQNINKLIVSS